MRIRECGRAAARFGRKPSLVATASASVTLSTALVTLAAALPPASAVAQIGTPASKGSTGRIAGGIPGVPDTVPQSDKPFLKEQERARKKALPKDDGSTAAPAGPAVSDEETDRATEAPEGEKPQASEGLVDGLQLPSVNPVDIKTGEEVKNVEGSTQANPELLPRLEMAPPPGVAAYLGQTLVMSAKLATMQDAKVPSLIAWVLDGKVVCEKETCELPLDGKTLSVGTSSLMVLAYNAYGSTFTRHVIQVLKSNWNPSKPFKGDFRKEEKPVAVTVPVPKAGADKPRSYMVKGNAVHAFPEYLGVLGTVPRPFEFRGRLKTQNVAVARLQDPGWGDWFVLGYSDVSFAREGIRRALTMAKGGVRMHSIPTGVAKKERRFAENVEIATQEARIAPSEGGDVYVTRLAPSKKALERRAQRKDNAPPKPEEMSSTRVVVIGGQARVTLAKPGPGRPAQVALPAGVEFVVYEDGSVAPLAKPNPKRMEKLMRMTVTPEETAEKARQRAKAGSIDLAKAIEQAAKLAESEDYFEIISVLSPVESRAREDARVPYYLGVANRGVYQISRAETFFRQAIAQKSDYGDAHWQLAQMNMELKKWPEAEENLDDAESSFDSDDKRRSEVPYYRGVVDFNQDNSFAAKNAFTRALWETTLDAALKQSSGAFLKSIGKKKDWTLVTPLGVQYERNALGLTSDDELPADYPRRDLVRLLGGAIFNYDKATNAERGGLYLGGGAKALVLYNLPRKGFSKLDAWVGEVSLSQTLVDVAPAPTEGQPPEISSTRLTESLTSVFVDGQLATQTATVGVLLGKIDLSVGYEHDAVGKGDASRSAVLGKQGYGLGLWSSDDGTSLDTDLLLEERYALKSNPVNGHQVTFSVTPAVSLPFSPRASSRLGVLLGLQHTRTAPATTVTRLGPSAAFNYFLAPWLLSVTSVGYEFNLGSPGSTKTHKPSASFILTGIF